MKNTSIYFSLALTLLPAMALSNPIEKEETLYKLPVGTTLKLEYDLPVPANQDMVVYNNDYDSGHDHRNEFKPGRGLSHCWIKLAEASETERKISEGRIFKVLDKAGIAAKGSFTSPPINRELLPLVNHQDEYMSYLFLMEVNKEGKPTGSNPVLYVKCRGADTHNDDEYSLKQAKLSDFFAVFSSNDGIFGWNAKWFSIRQPKASEAK